MDKYEYKVKLDQIEKLAAKRDYVTAAKIADGIDWRKVKSVTTLTMIADIYEASNRLEDCYELLNMIYDRSPIGRRVVYRLAEVAVRMHDFEEAIELYKEFVRIAPHDLNKYILKYQIYRERGSSVEDQIKILEEYKNHEYDEKWSYELASLYEEAGQIDRCIEECDELILWFSEGEYVVKAMELKRKYQELTASQLEKYEHRFEYLEKEAKEAEAFDEEDVETEETVEETEKVSETAEETQEEVPDTEEVISEVSVEESPVTETEEVVETDVLENEQQQEAVEEKTEDDTPTISEINTNKFSTINLQAELAKGIQMFLEEGVEEEEQPEPQEATQEFVPVKDAVRTEAAWENVTVTEKPAVEDVKTEETVEEIVEEVKTEKTAEETLEEVKTEKIVEEVVEEETAQKPRAQEMKKESLSETAEIQSEILKYAAVKQEPKMEDYFHTEEDGQLSLAIGENNVLEKQITGQMTIEEILEAWEEKKRQAREQIANAESKKQAVPFETGEITSLLEDFIPKTPKDVQALIEEIEAETTGEVKAPEDSQPEKEEVSEAENVVEEELEDDLPMDIDLADVLEAALEEPKEEEQEEKALEPVEEVPAKETKVREEEPANDRLGENTASMLDAIERALALEITPIETSGKYLTEEQEKIFAYFTSVSGMKKQLLNLLNEDHLYVGKTDSKEGNLIITGHPGNGKTTLAIDIVKAFQRQRREKGGKLAKVTGDGLNKKDPAEVVKKLGGGALIIERAGGLKDEIVEKLSEAMEDNTGGLLVILEDDFREINRLLEKHVRFAAKFTRSVDIPIFSNDELVAFGKSYAEEQEYYFEEMAVLALYDCIGVRQTSDHVVNITEVKEFVDDAIAHAEKKSKGLFAKLSKKRIDEYGNKLLLEEDFDY